MLGHIGTGAIKWLDNSEMESSANAFAAEVISPSSFVSMTSIIVAITAVVISLFIGYNLHTSKTITVLNEHLSTQTSELEDSIVYITSSGSKYHSVNCIHIRNKECAMVNKQQAQRIFEPCSVCNP